MNAEQQLETLATVAAKLAEARALLASLRDAGGHVGASAAVWRLSLLGVGSEIAEVEIELGRPR